MRAPPSRPAVFAALAVVLALAYLLGLHWWFTVPMLRMGDEIETTEMIEKPRG